MKGAFDRMLDRALGNPSIVAPAPAPTSRPGPDAYQTPVLDRPIERPEIPLSTGATLPRLADCCEHRQVVLRLEDENARLRTRVEELEARRLNQRQLWDCREPFGSVA